MSTPPILRPLPANTRRALPVTFWHFVPLLLLLSPFFVAGLYTFPAADDFNRGVRASHLFDFFGGISEMLRAWSNWSGRYTHHFLIIFLGDAVNSRVGYGLLCIGHISLYAVALYGIFSQIAPDQPRRDRSLLALFTLAALLCSYRPLGFPWYLATDILGLGVARLLTLLYIWSLLAVWNAPIFSIASRISAVVSLILMSGAYEYATFMAPICSLTAWGLAKANNNVHTNFYRLLCAVAILCFIVSIFAPGNFQREAVEGASQEAFLGLPRSSFHDWGFIVLAALLSPFPAYLAVVAVWLSPSLTPILRKRLTLVLALNIAALGWFTLAVALLHAAANVPVAASGKVLPSLMMFGSYFLFFAYVCCGMIANRTRWPRTGFTPVFAILCCFLALSSNYLNVLWSLAGGSLSALASIMEQRQEIMLRNQGKDVVFPPIASCPEPVCFGEVIARRSADWPNRDIAKLYNLRSVSLLPRRFPEARAAELPGQSWRILHAGDEGSERVAVAIQRDVQSGPNAAFRDDWLVVRTSEAPSQAPVSLQAIVVADDGLLVAVLGLMKLEPPSWIWSPWLSKVVEERTIRGIEEFNRNFHGVAGTIKSFPLWQVDSQVPVSVDAQNRYAAFPLYNAGSFRSALVYLSLDGAVFYRIDVLPCERVCDKGGDTKEGVARS